MVPGLSWLSNVAKVGYCRISPLFQNMEPYHYFFKMAVSVNQNGHFEEMEAWLQILQIVGNSTLLYQLLTLDNRDSPGSVSIWKSNFTNQSWNCGENLSKSPCVKSILQDSVQFRSSYNRFLKQRKIHANSGRIVKVITPALKQMKSW